MRWLLKAAGLPLALVPSVALPLLLVGAAEEPGKAAEDAYRALPELPAAAPADNVDDLEQAAVELAARLNAVPLSETAAEICPAERLEVSWTAPGEDYEWGAHLDPVGPAPTAATDAVNGVVICEGSRYAFMGFEAWRTDGDWSLAAVPYVHEEAEEHHEAPAPAEPAPAPAQPAPPAPAPAAPAVPAPLSLELPSGAIEGYAAYEPQRLCDPTPKPGTLALRNLLLGNNPGTRNLGISRACGAGGQSEHKEGRALDWGVLVSRANEKAAAERFIGQLMSTDDQGNRHALARRMGVMYVIWNRQIWSAYRASQGWRPYGGASPHTDHVHISLSWAGAQGRTSFWSGKVDPSTLLAYQPALPSGGSGGLPAAQPAGNTHRREVAAVLPTEAVRDATDDGRRRGRRGKDGESGEQRRRWEELSEDERQALLARRAERRAEDGDHDWRERGDDRDRHDERSERRALRRAEREKRRAEEAAREEAERDAHEDVEVPVSGAIPVSAPAGHDPSGEHGERDGRGRGRWRGRDEARHLAEAQRRAEAQRHAEAERQAAAQREAARQAEAQRQAEHRQQREAQRRAEAQRQAEREQRRQRGGEVEQRRGGGRHGGGEGGERRRRRGEWSQDGHGAEVQAGGGERRGNGGKGHGKGQGKGKGGGHGKGHGKGKGGGKD